MARKSSDSILDCIGNTSLLPCVTSCLRMERRILLKMESENPTGSMKDRMALAMIEAGEADGRRKPGGAVVEYTGGSTGVSLAFVCAVKRHPLHSVSSDAFAREKLDHLRLLEAMLQIVPSEGGGMTEKLTREMIEAAGIVAANTGAFWTDQMKNKDQMAPIPKWPRKFGSKAAASLTDSCKASGRPHPFEALQRAYAGAAPNCGSLRSSRQNRQSSPVADRERIRLTESAPDLSFRCGTTISLIRLSKYQRKNCG